MKAQQPSFTMNLADFDYDNSEEETADSDSHPILFGLVSCPLLEARDCTALDIKIFLPMCCSKREMLISEKKIVTHHYTCFSDKQTWRTVRKQSEI